MSKRSLCQSQQSDITESQGEDEDGLDQASSNKMCIYGPDHHASQLRRINNHNFMSKIDSDSQYDGPFSDVETENDNELSYSSSVIEQASCYDSDANQPDEVNCGCYDSYFTCQYMSEASKTCWKCKTVPVCKSCWVAVRRCHECYTRTNTHQRRDRLNQDRHIKSHEDDEPVSDEFQGVFAVSTDERLLSPEESLFCASIMSRSDALQLNSVWATGKASGRVAANNIRTALTTHGFAELELSQFAKFHEDTRARKLIPLYVKEQFLLGEVLASQYEGEYPFMQEPVRATGRFFLGYEFTGHGMADLHRNIARLLRYCCGNLSKSVVLGSFTGWNNTIDYITAPVDSKDEKLTKKFIDNVDTSLHSNDRHSFPGATVIVNFTCDELPFNMTSGDNRNEMHTVHGNSVMVIWGNKSFGMSFNSEGHELRYAVMALDPSRRYRDSFHSTVGVDNA